MRVQCRPSSSAPRATRVTLPRRRHPADRARSSRLENPPIPPSAATRAQALEWARRAVTARANRSFAVRPRDSLALRDAHASEALWSRAKRPQAQRYFSWALHPQRARRAHEALLARQARLADERSALRRTRLSRTAPRRARACSPTARASALHAACARA